MRTALAIDVGGTKISGCLINENGEIISSIEKYSTPKSADEIFFTLRNIVDKHVNYDVVAIATAGAVNLQNSKLIGATGNLAKGYSDIVFSRLSAKPVFVENDANAATWAEFILGSAKDFENAVIITLGTGVGGGVVINKKLFRGKSGAGPELGHLKLHTNIDRPCTCGSDNCFEAYASGTGLRKTLQEEALKNSKFQNSCLFEKEVVNLTTYDLVEAYKKEDEFAKEVFEIWHKQLAQGLLAINNIFDTDIIVLSGSMADFVDFDYLEKFVNNETITMPTQIKKAKFDNNSGMIGAALLALKKYED